MTKLFLPSFGAILSAQNVFHEVQYKRRLNKRPNEVILAINAGLFLTNAAIFRSMLHDR